MLLFDDLAKNSSGFKKVVIYISITILFYVITSLFIGTIFNYGLEKYYCLEPADVLIIGHSMSEMGLDKTQIEDASGLKVAKYCMNGAGLNDRLIMIKHYIEATQTVPKVVIYDISARSFSYGLSANSYVLFYPFINKSTTINNYLKNHATKADYWTKKFIILNRYDTTRLGAVYRGYSSNWRNMSLKTFDSVAFQKRVESGNFWKISFDPDAIDILEKTISFLEDREIDIWLCKFPCVDILNNAEQEKSKRAMEIFDKLATQYRNVRIVDYNKDMESDYSNFVDPIHMSRKGQIELSNKLAKDLKEYKNRL